MSEVHIRINKRAFERTIYWLIIIALVIFLFVRQPTVGNADSEQVDAMQAQIDNLTANNQQLQEQVDSLQQANADLVDEKQELEEEQEEQQQAEPEEPQLSGELEFDWAVRMDGDSLDYVIITIDNGLEDTQTVTYRLRWDHPDYQYVTETGDVTVRSGESERVTIDDYLSTPGEDIDGLELQFRDSDGDLIDELTKEVR